MRGSVCEAREFLILYLFFDLLCYYDPHAIINPTPIQERKVRLGHKFKNKNELFRVLTYSKFSKEENDKIVGTGNCPHLTPRILPDMDNGNEEPVYVSFFEIQENIFLV